MPAIKRGSKRYPTARSDEEWHGIAPLLPQPASRAGEPGLDVREVVNAIRYMTRTLGAWHMLPRDFPPWQTVHCWFCRFVRLLLFRTIYDIARMIERERPSQESGPNAGLTESRTVEASAPSGKRAQGSTKKRAGRKRYIVVDSEGRLLMVNLTSTDLATAC